MFYIRFVDPAKDPFLTHLASPIRESLHLEGTPDGEVVLDVLHDGRIGGMELYDKLIKHG